MVCHSRRRRNATPQASYGPLPPVSGGSETACSARRAMQGISTVRPPGDRPRRPREATVHAAAETGCIQKPNSAPVATTSSATTNDADIRVCAYWRSSSVSKAGRVPLDDVNRSRASRTRCAATRRALTGAAGAGSAGSWTTSGFSAGLLIQTTQIAPRAARTFALSICGPKCLSDALKT